jgi:hypothetical protein
MDFEVHLSLDAETQRIGSARSNRVRGKETVVFEYWSFLPRDSSNGQCLRAWRHDSSLCIAVNCKTFLPEKRRIR